jgi:hypothetical protein
MRSLLIVPATLLLAGLLPAQTTLPNQPVTPTPGAAFTDLSNYLGLTESQVSALVAIQQEQQTAISQLYTQLNQDYETLQTLLQATSPNALSIGQAMIEIQNLQNQINQAGTSQYQTQALAVLNQNQLTLLKNLNTALQLQSPAYEAVSVFLLTLPQGPICGVTLPCGVLPPATGSASPALRLVPALRSMPAAVPGVR